LGHGTQAQTNGGGTQEQPPWPNLYDYRLPGQFIAAIIIAGFLFSPGPRLVDSLTAFARRILSDQGEEMVQLAGNTIRNVSRGVVGVALVQSFLPVSVFSSRVFLLPAS
jgi:hypothetical protein